MKFSDEARANASYRAYTELSDRYDVLVQELAEFMKNMISAKIPGDYSDSSPGVNFDSPDTSTSSENNEEDPLVSIADLVET